MGKSCRTGLRHHRLAGSPRGDAPSGSGFLRRGRRQAGTRCEGGHQRPKRSRVPAACRLFSRQMCNNARAPMPRFHGASERKAIAPIPRSAPAARRCGAHWDGCHRRSRCRHDDLRRERFQFPCNAGKVALQVNGFTMRDGMMTEMPVFRGGRLAGGSLRHLATQGPGKRATAYQQATLILRFKSDQQ